MLDEARKQCLMAFASAGTHNEAKNCVKEVDARRFDEWSTQIEEKTSLVKQLGEAKAYEMAQNELKEVKTLSADARSKLRVLAPLDKGGSPADKRLMEAVQRFKTANASVATTETDERLLALGFATPTARHTDAATVRALKAHFAAARV